MSTDYPDGINMEPKHEMSAQQKALQNIFLKHQFQIHKPKSLSVKKLKRYLKVTPERQKRINEFAKKVLEDRHDGIS